MLQNDSLLATPLSFFGKAKFALVITEADTVGTEALIPRWAKHRTFSSLPSWVPITLAKNSLKAFSTSSLCATASRLCIFLGTFYIFFGLGVISLPLVLHRDFTEVFISDMTDVTQSLGETTYFGSSLDLAPQGNNYCYDFLCNLISFLYSALNSLNAMEQSFLTCLRGAALATFYVRQR